MEEEKKGEGLHEELIIVLRTGTFKLEEKGKSQVEVFLTLILLVLVTCFADSSGDLNPGNLLKVGLICKKPKFKELLDFLSLTLITK